MIPLLLLLASVGLAADDAPSAPAAAPAPPPLPATVPGWRELYVALRQLHDHLGQPLALGAVGPEARAVGRKATTLFSDGEVRLRPIPTAGDDAAELSLAQASTGASCVVWMTGADAGWSLAARGDCAPAATDDDDAVELPPLLRLVPRRGEPGWRVYEVDGGRIDTWRYATLTRDPELRDRLVTERRRRHTGARLLELSGIALASAASIPVIQSFGLSHELAEDRRLTAVFMVASGGALFLGGRLDRRGLDVRQAEVASYVHRTDAEAAIDDWNRRAQQQRARLDGAADAPTRVEEAPQGDEDPQSDQDPQGDEDPQVEEDPQGAEDPQGEEDPQ